MTFRWPNGQYYFKRILLSQNIEYRVIDKNVVGGRIAMNLEAHIIIHWSMCNLEHACKMLDDNIEVVFIGSTNNAIVDEDSDDKVNCLSRGEAIIDTGVRITCNKIVEFEECIKGMIPKSPRLLKTI